MKPVPAPHYLSPFLPVSFAVCCISPGLLSFHVRNSSHNNAACSFCLLLFYIIIEGQTKTLIIETPPVASYCPICGFRMHSRGVKKRTINHPILQDGYSLILLLKQRRWRCSNPDCLYEVNESFRFVNKGRRTTNATDMLIVEAYRNLLETSASIAKRFHMSDTYVHEIFDRYVKLDRLPLTDAISIDEVHLDMDDDCKYALVIQDFHTGAPIDLLRSRRTSVTEPYFVSISPSALNRINSSSAFQTNLQYCAVVPATACGHLQDCTVWEVFPQNLKCGLHLPQCAVGH